MKKLHFQVDSRLATLLSQEYSSTEKALKELVDNAWDADAEQVSITLPAPLSNDPILVIDDGTGMTAQELSAHYLKIASDRRSKRGLRTTGKQRLIKGRKGIGKFAGLMAASVMKLTTCARSNEVSFTLSLKALEEQADIEHLPIDAETRPCSPELHGTSIALSDLHQELAYPDANKLRQILLQEYGRQKDFSITVNGKPLAIDDLSGTYREDSTTLLEAGDVTLRFTISDAKTGLRQPGITLMVDGKAVGKPSFFGLDECDDFPPKLLRKMFGEVDADGLSEHVTAGWDAVVENSELLHQVSEHVQGKLRAAFVETHGVEMRLAHARLQKTIHERLAGMPEFKREYADRAIKRILEKYYDEAPSKVEPIVFVILEALERSDYRILLEHVAEAKRRDISAVVDSLSEFGLADMAFLVEQASARSAYLDQLEMLAATTNTLEATMHRAIENSLWILGPEYSLFSSNKTLQRQVEDYLGDRYIGEFASKRPDLLLSEDLHGEYLLIEFKRPSHALKYVDYQQATGYRHDFAKHVSKPIKVLIIGGKRSEDFPLANLEPNVSAMLFVDVFSTARRQIQWQLRSRPA
ncbi:ATP-binding protein [Pseudomonas koreensis]|uniref:Histidine kinase-, DNA gyrase B-, and HSP90-like ATPase n=1 Tax=Pseudomonas koreensis TaxID=198620 RepID=A0AA94EKB6_9PSED|nr:ATP-binding protein [Pseudomonas koreensis]RVD75802.1 Histidine kinase-, DNA gyrase B-, and HSP90-like ATPase [Pseudomonas koreensis]